MTDKTEQIRLLIKEYEECSLKLETLVKHHFNKKSLIENQLKEKLKLVAIDHNEKYVCKYLAELQRHIVEYAEQLQMKFRKEEQKTEDNIIIEYLKQYEKRINILIGNYKKHMQQLTQSVEYHEHELEDKIQHIEYLKKEIKQIDLLAGEENSDRAEMVVLLQSLSKQLNTLKSKYKKMQEKWVEKAGELKRRKFLLCEALKRGYENYKGAKDIAEFYKGSADISEQTLIEEKSHHEKFLEDTVQQICENNKSSFT